MIKLIFDNLDYKDVKFSCGMLVPYESTPSISRQNSSSPSSSSPRQQHILLRQRSNGWSDIKSQILPFKNEKIYCLIKMNQVTEDKVLFLLLLLFICLIVVDLFIFKLLFEGNYKMFCCKRFNKQIYD